MRDTHERELMREGKTLAAIQGGTYALAGVAIVDLGRSCAVAFWARGLRGPDPACRHLRPPPLARPPLGKHSGRPPGSLRAPQTAEVQTTTRQRKQRRNRNLRTSGDGEI